MTFPTNGAVTEKNLAPGGDLTNNVVAAQDVPGSAAVQVRNEPSGGSDTAGFLEEQPVWEARYSARNFLVRSVVAGVVTLIWAVLAIGVWTQAWPDYRFALKMLGIGFLLIWVYLGWRALRAWHSHHYRLTTRRLFVSNGFFRRRVDQIELLRVKDLYLQQSMVNQWLNVGTVVVVSSEHTLPRAALLGIHRPQLVMDLIWQYTRREQDRKTTAIEQV
jgi:hypothetical protein